jgi:hypothetical protein
MTVAKNKRGGSTCPEWEVRMIGMGGQLAPEYTIDLKLFIDIISAEYIYVIV